MLGVNRLVLVGVVVWVSSMVAASQAAPGMAPAQVNALVRQTIDNEIKATRDYSQLFQYRLEKETNSGKSLREMLETTDGIVARTITWNGRALTAEERAKEDDRLSLLVSNEEERKKKFKEQREDTERALQMLRALPDALLYEFAGRDNIRGRDTIRLHFRPNPQFSSSAKETYLFRAAEGALWIDVAAHRIVKLDGVTKNDVNIGWGILGHINKGGKILLEQSLVAEPNHFRITTLNIEAQGKVLLFKNIRIRQLQTATSFSPVDRMTIAEAVKRLRGDGARASGSD
jgi:hypothetical protein